MTKKTESVSSFKKTEKQEELTPMPFQLYQPWSSFIMKTQLPPLILEKMIRITDAIVDNVENEENVGRSLVGQIKDELGIKHEVLERENVMGFLWKLLGSLLLNNIFNTTHSILCKVKSMKKKIGTCKW